MRKSSFPFPQLIYLSANITADSILTPRLSSAERNKLFVTALEGIKAAKSASDIKELCRELYRGLNSEVVNAETVIEDLNNRLLNLSQQLNDHTHGTILRPTTAETSISVEIARAINLEELLNEHRTHSSINTDKFRMITQGHATEILATTRDASNELGCHFSTKATIQHGYRVKNLANTKCRIPDRTEENVGLKPAYLHHLALIADNRLEQLLGASAESGLHCSHLCHQKACFNPKHLVIEENTRNIERNNCQGQKILVYKDFRFNPCSHGGEGKIHYKCILPQYEFKQGGSYSVNELEQ